MLAMITNSAMGGMGEPLINVADGLVFHKFQGVYQKKRQQHLGTQKRAAQLSLARREQRQRWTGHRTCRRKSNPGNTSMNQKRGIRKNPHPGKEKDKSQMGLTATFWPILSIANGCFAGARHASSPFPPASGTTSSACRIGSRVARNTGQSKKGSSPSLPV